MRYSIVIPTKDGQHTLPATLATALGQAGYDFEVIVTDSSHHDQTQQLLDGCADPRLRRLRNPGLTMQDNWEAGVEATTGDYVTVLGHDDGLMPDALEICDAILGQTSPEVITWRRHFYGWPCAVAEHVRNRLVILFGAGFARLAGRQMLEDFFAAKRSFEIMPMIYNSFVSRRIITMVRARHGRYFGGEIPDVHSGIVNAAFCGEVLFSNRSLSLSGSAAGSCGASGLQMDRHPEGWRDFADGYHRTVLHSALQCGSAAELWDMLAMPTFACLYSAHQARDIHFQHDVGLKVDTERWLQHVCGQLGNYPASYSRRRSFLELLAARYGVPCRLPESVPPMKPPPQQGLHQTGQTPTLLINCEQASVQDVAAAARLAQAVLPPPLG